jgi:hypothetical protein
MQREQNQGNQHQLKNGIGWLVLICRALAVSVEVFLHKGNTFGQRYLGPQVGVAALILFFWPAFRPGVDTGPVFGFLIAFLVMCFCARAAILRRGQRGDLTEHSRYTGRPWLMRIAGRTSEAKVKGMLEPLLVWLAAVLTMPLSEALGNYLLLAGFGLLVSVQMTLASERQRVLDMHDAYVDQRNIVEQWRERRRD